MNDNHFFKAARECSKNADYCGSSSVKIGCIIAYKGSILAKGWNTDKTHSVQARYNKWRYKESNRYLPAKLHSELAALRRIKYLNIDFSKVHIYIYREYQNGKLALCRPCNACFAAIKQMGIRHIHYTTEDGFCYEKISSL